MNMGPSYLHDQWSQETSSQKYNQQGYNLNPEDDEVSLNVQRGELGATS
jgi:hypothetical protein